jgi:outer membrane protein OmpA-like peptidoglycan-associated protein
MRIDPTLENVAADSISDVTAGRFYPRSARFLHNVVACAALSLLSAGLGACVQTASQTSPPSGAPAVAAPLPPVLPFDQAVLNAANTVLAAAPAGSHRVVIDPLVDGVTGYGSTATDGIQTRITDLAQRQYQQLSIEKFSPDSLKGSPLVLVGTFTPVNLQNQTTGTREAYRFCLVLGDLRTGQVVAKAVARAQLAGVDATPSTVFRDSPVWTPDPATQAYISTCQATKVGDPINKAFLDGLATAALISQGDQAYNAGQYSAALNLYNAAKQQPAGDQLKAYNGLYLANLKLNQEPQATVAFGDAVSYGLRRNRLAVKFLFEPGSTRFYRDPQISGQYPVWMQQIAERAAQQTAQANNCIEVSGHTSSTGSPAVNERLSMQRAEYVRAQLVRDIPELRGRLLASGAGSSQTLVGTGKDDISDALDRRVEFKPGAKCS